MLFLHLSRPNVLPVSHVSMIYSPLMMSYLKQNLSV